MAAKLKKHLSISEQVNRLEERGLVIVNRNSAEDFLSRVNYYRFSGYLHDFRLPGSDRYIDGVTFDMVVTMYEFDMKLNRLLMFALEDIEETFKTRYSYCLSSCFPNNPLIYREKKIYRNEDELKKSRNRINAAKRNNSELPFIKHHIDNYNGQLPIWVAVEIMTMGTIRALYINLQSKYQKMIAKEYNTNPVILTNWITNMTYTRNHLAHYMRVYNYNFARIPASCKNHPTTVVFRGGIFDQIKIMSFLFSDKGLWNNYFVPELEKLMQDYRDTITLKGLGFPENWKDELMV